MTSVMKLSDLVDVVIGVDTHVETHSAAAVDVATGAVLAQITVIANAEGYAELVAFADQVAEDHAALRAWAVEGTASHGRGLAAHLRALDEVDGRDRGGAAGLEDRLLDRFERLGVATGQHHMGALGRQRDRGCRADAPAGAGDERHVSFERRAHAALSSAGKRSEKSVSLVGYSPEKQASQNCGQVFSRFCSPTAR